MRHAVEKKNNKLKYRIGLMAINMKVEVRLRAMTPSGKLMEEHESGDGGNRTPVQREDPQDFYICSLIF
jgi:hypothetical protein